MQGTHPTFNFRFNIMLTVALGIHVAVILGVAFEQKLSREQLFKSRHLEVTLVQSATSLKPVEANFLAQSNQMGGGEVILSVPTRAQTPARFQVEMLRRDSVQATSSGLRFSGDAESSHPVLLSNTGADTIERIEQSSPHEKQQMAEVLESRIAHIENLRTLISSLSQASSKDQKRRQVSAASHEARDAAYLAQWRQRIEHIGNLNYPDEARRQQLHGELQLLVAINKDGSLYSIEVRRSSGYKVLDDAAIRIVQLAAPFPPLPKVMQDADILEIIRTWQFLPGQSLTTNAG